MSRRSAPDRYNERRLSRLGAEKQILKVNREGVFETVVASPSEYCVGMSLLDYHVILRQLSTWPDTICERAFYPERDELNWLKRSGRPVTTLESGRSIAGFDLLVFSIGFVTDYLPMFEMMRLSNLEMQSSRRESPWPLIACCGLPTTANPLPLSLFIDFFIIGETEPSLGPVLDTIKSLGTQGAPKRVLLERIAELPGLYVPLVHGSEKPDTTIMRQWAMSEALRGHSICVSDNCIISGKVLVETARGCPFNCGFCLDGYIHLPYRERKAEEVIASLESIPGEVTLALASDSPAVHTGLEEIVQGCQAEGRKTCIGSLRIESPSTLQRSGSDFDDSILVLFPEAGSDGLRKVIGKKLTNEEVLDRVGSIESSIGRIRLHFMLGLPFEMDEDRQAIVELVKEVRCLTKVPIEVSMTSFVPRPWTAFQWMPMRRPQHLRKWAREIESGLRRVKRTKCFFSDPRDAQIEALMARGDYRAGLALEHKLEGLSWTASFEKAGISMDWVFEQLEPGDPFPWDFLNMGFGHTRLARELTAAMSANVARTRKEEPAKEEED